MAQRPTKPDRVGYVLHVFAATELVRLPDGKANTDGLRMTAREHGPAPSDPWSDQGPWGVLDGLGLNRDVRLRVEYTPTPQGATDVEILALVENWALRLPLTRDAGMPAAEEVTLRRRDGRPVSGRDMARLGLGAVHQALVRVLSDPLSVAHLGETWGAVEVPQPGRRGRDDLSYARHALAYVKALAESPKTPVRHLIRQAEAAGDHVTEDELRARHRRARKRGLLTSAPKGRPGGELTDKAKGLLREAGLLEEESDK